MVYADTMEERERWVAALNQQINRLKERALQRRSRRNVRYVGVVLFTAVCVLRRKRPGGGVVRRRGRGGDGLIFGAA